MDCEDLTDEEQHLADPYEFGSTTSYSGNRGDHSATPSLTSRHEGSVAQCDSRTEQTASAALSDLQEASDLSSKETAHDDVSDSFFSEELQEDLEWSEEEESTTTGQKISHSDDSEDFTATSSTDSDIGSESETDDAPESAVPQPTSTRPELECALTAVFKNSVLKLTAEAPIFINITISDDQSAGSKIAERHLLALRDPKKEAWDAVADTRRTEDDRIHDILRHPRLQEYQMQLMLLERQNRKRLMMERQELDDLITMTGRGLATGLGSPSFDGEARSLGSHNKQELPSVVAGLQRVLGVSDTSQLDLVKLEEYIGLLQRQVKQLEADRKDQPPSRLQILNRIRETHYISRKGRTEVETKLSMPYFDEPEWVLGQGAERQLQCKLPLHNFDLYLEKNKDVSFIVYRNFDPFLVDNAGLRTTNRGNRGAGLLPELHPQPNSETIQPISQALISAIENILGTREEYSTVLQQFQLSRELKAPYLFIYHSRKDLDAIQENFSPEACKEVSLLLDYIKSQYGDKYATADALFERGKITSDYIHYVFKPGDILVQREDGRYKAFVATGWPSMGSIKYASRLGSRAIQDRGLPLYGTEEASMRIRHEKIKLQDWSVTGWHWAFDGNFQREHSSHYFDIEVEKVDKWDNATSSSAWQKRRMEEPKPKESEITDLQVFPIKYANADLVDTLRKRGSTFWKCRNRRLVSYMQTDRFGAQNMAEERYMVDLLTHSSLHKDNVYASRKLEDELGAEALAKDEPPDEKFNFLVPEKWHDLEVDRISEVQWNVEAFQSLVIDRKAKDLIRALVSKQVAAEKGTDLIEGKGNGLILLLHGGPGTGKTLTAESVAEIAQKPLYRVTCGDVGTKAEDVEKYLESVLHLGKIWGCVVLLDEADVFLEQRSLADLQRNALVSVFLRVMEYYEGILVLTSNRVGTFDEAFKSRIQLALHYPSLGNYQRLRIWENFIKRLESFDDNTIDIADLRDHLEVLSKEKMNGRQIRNAITTARQYAEWKGTKMTYEHLKDVIEVAGRFDEYLDKLHDGFTADQLAEDEGLRLA